MLLLQVLALLVQVNSGQPDLPAIVKAVLQEVVSSEVHSESPLYVDVQQTASAFREVLLPAASLSLSDVSRAVPGHQIAAGEEDEVVSCVRGGARVRPKCTIAGNGLFVSIREARHGPQPGEVLVVVRVLWADASGELLGYDMEMFLARSTDTDTPESAGWEVVRKGTAIVR